MNNPLISIITINFNNLEGLKKTMRSVAEQTYPEIEYIVIDGNSTDGSAEYLETYSGALQYWVSEPDTGIFNAMNKGMAKASGDFLLFLNSGDALTDGSILEAFVSHKKFEGEIIYGDYTFEEGGKQYPDTVTPLFFLKSSLPHQSTLFHKSVFEKMGSYREDYRIAADRHFYLSCLVSDQFQFSHVPIALTEFDLSGVSNDKDFHKKKEEEDIALFMEVLGVYYEDYRRLLHLEREVYHAKRNTVSGILKRILKRLTLGR
ncbi:glycosyltransferase family 2 protein [Luteirhabdus pelagi]|uniref:glycosyltransferase family 2 protein n=1 Tax=Luteirhabdus pelagi TaxID=2792783 RepID=UPI00193956B7|nr:glycosyltransferase family 2 protein [Luteirhabdus pelagi]